MKLANQRFVESWPVATVQDLELQADVFEHPDGRQHVYFSSAEFPVDVDNSQSDTNRIGFRKFDNEVLFLGILIAKQMRGRGLGKDLIDYFVDTVGTMGYDFAGTGYIHKPIVALSLKRAGLKPEKSDFLAEILPHSQTFGDGLPRLNILQNKSPESENIVRVASGGGLFYEVVPVEERVRKFPINAPDMVVSLHTTYLPRS